MPRYKPIDTGMKLLPVDLSRQLLPGTFEYGLSHLIDHALDPRILDSRFRNDENGAPAYAPVVVSRRMRRRAGRATVGFARADDLARDAGKYCWMREFFRTRRVVMPMK